MLWTQRSSELKEESFVFFVNRLNKGYQSTVDNSLNILFLLHFYKIKLYEYVNLLYWLAKEGIVIKMFTWQTRWWVVVMASNVQQKSD